MTTLQRAWEIQQEIREAQAALDAKRKAFEALSSVVDLKDLIEDLQEERKEILDTCTTKGITADGAYFVKTTTRTVRTVIPALFAAEFGLELFCKVASVPVGAAEKLVGKKALAAVVEEKTTVTGVTVDRIGCAE